MVNAKGENGTEEEMKSIADTKNDMWLFSYTEVFLKVWSTECFSNFNRQMTCKNTVKNLNSDSVPGKKSEMLHFQ